MTQNMTAVTAQQRNTPIPSIKDAEETLSTGNYTHHRPLSYHHSALFATPFRRCLVNVE